MDSETTVFSIFGTTSEFPNHGSNQIDFKLYEDFDIHPRLKHFHYKDKHVFKTNEMRQLDRKARRKREMRDPCESFTFKPGTSESTTLTNPRDKPDSMTYSSNTTCITTIDAGEGHVVLLTFVDKFMIEGHPPKCENDYLEIRDGKFGYALPVYKYCGTEAPASIVSSGPHVWLKFTSDDTIEYEGFHLRVDFQPNANSRKRPESCYKTLTGRYGEVGSHGEDVKGCKDQSPSSVDIQWMIETPPGTSIFLNFTEYALAMPNDCESNLVQVFGAKPDFDHKLAVYCGSATNPVTTKLPNEGLGPSNIMYIRMYASGLARDSKFKAQFTAFRTMEGASDACSDDEFDCEDGTCIDVKLKCDGTANCRLKADEECLREKDSLLKEPRILIMLSIFSLVLFAVGLFFLVRCIRKVYRDHQNIKEQLQAKSQDQLDRMSEVEFSFGSDTDSEARESLERENLTNEMYTQQMNARTSSSIGSGSLRPDTPDLGDDWPDHTPILAGNKLDYKGRPRRKASRKESLRSKALKEERKEEYKSRPRNSEARQRKVSLRTQNSREETWNDTESKGNKRKNSKKVRKTNEHGTEIENTVRRDKVQEELSRTNTLKEEKDIEYKGRTRRDTNKKEQLPKAKRSNEEEWEETEYKERHKCNTNKREKLAATKDSREEHKEVEYKERHKHDTNKGEQLPRAKDSREEWKETEYKDKHKRDTNKRKQLPAANDSREEWKETEYKDKHERDTNKREPLLAANDSREEWKKIEYKDKQKRDTNKREPMPAANDSREEWKETEYKDKQKRDTNKREPMPAANDSREEWKETEYKDKHERDTNKREPLPAANDSREEWKETEYKDKHKHDTNKREPLPLAKESREDLKELQNKGRPRRSDTNKKEESLKTKTSKEEWKDKQNMSRPRDTSEKEESLKNKSSEEMISKDVSVGTQDTKESGCQTRESLFLTDPVSSDGTNSYSKSRGRLAFGCSNTISQPPANTSQITIDLQATPREPVNIHVDRRPMSSETTRSAPDVIIVAKPMRLS